MKIKKIKLSIKENYVKASSKKKKQFQKIEFRFSIFFILSVENRTDERHTDPC